MTRLFIFPSFSVTILVSESCKKSDESKVEQEKFPSADFSFDKPSYLAGDKILLTNKSSDATYFKWTLPDGTTTNERDFSWTTYPADLSKQLSFTLEATSKSGLKSDQITKTIEERQQTGTLTLYTYNRHHLYGDLWIDNVYMGYYYFPKIPPTSCGQEGYPTFTLGVGNHIIEVDGIKNTVGVGLNNCTISWY